MATQWLQSEHAFLADVPTGGEGRHLHHQPGRVPGFFAPGATASQRAQAIKRRRQIWDALHPEDKQPSQVGTPVAKHGHEQAVKFATDTAAVSGEGRSSIYRHLARADALGDDLEHITGTSLDKGTEMDALKAMPEPGLVPGRSLHDGRCRRVVASAPQDESRDDLSVFLTVFEVGDW